MLEPHIVGPHSPDRARPLSALAAEVAQARRSGNYVINAELGTTANAL